MSVRSTLEAKLHEQEKSLTNNRKRLQELNTIISNLSSCTGDGMSEVNGKIIATCEELRLAVADYYIQCLGDLESSQDKGASDSNVDSAMSDLTAERRTVENKITVIESNIRTLRRRIAEAIEEERKNLF